MPPLKTSPEVRKKIIEKLLTSQERKALYSRVKDALESVLTREEIAPEKAYITGSFASKKQAPRDIDVIGEYLENLRPKDTLERDPLLSEIWATTHGTGLDYSPVFKGRTPRNWRDEGIPPALGTVRKIDKRIAKERYGKDYNWIRILSLLGALGSTAKKAAQEVGSEEVNYDNPAD